MNQYEEYLGTHELEGYKSLFLLDEEEVDLIILDNFMDISAKLVKLDDQHFPFFMNTGFVKNGLENMQITDFLDVEKSINNWRLIIDFLKNLFPKAKFVFLSFQYSTLVDKPERFNLAKSFNTKMSQALSDSNVFFIPSMFVEPKLTKGVIDWAHFNNLIYKGLASLIFMHLYVKSEVPLQSIFNNFDEEELEKYQNALKSCCLI